MPPPQKKKKHKKKITQTLHSKHSTIRMYSSKTFTWVVTLLGKLTLFGDNTNSVIRMNPIESFHLSGHTFKFRLQEN